MPADSASLLPLIILLTLVVIYLVIRWTNGPNGPFVTIFEWEYGVSYFDGRFEQILPPGRHFNWRRKRRVVYRLRKTEQLLVTPVTDVTSADRLVFRMAATLTYKIVDPRAALANNYLEKIQLAAATALPHIAAARTLDALILDRGSLGPELLALTGARIAGCEIIATTIGSVVLPPEVRRLFSEVERARLEGVAALERARGEQAALRSLANAARMLKGNAELMNLRLLQSLAGRGQATVVLGSNAILPTSPRVGNAGEH